MEGSSNSKVCRVSLGKGVFGKLERDAKEAFLGDLARIVQRTQACEMPPSVVGYGGHGRVLLLVPRHQHARGAERPWGPGRHGPRQHGAQLLAARPRRHRQCHARDRDHDRLGRDGDGQRGLFPGQRAAALRPDAWHRHAGRSALVHPEHQPRCARPTRKSWATHPESGGSNGDAAEVT